jgi:hypothetical protein
MPESREQLLQSAKGPKRQRPNEDAGVNADNKKRARKSVSGASSTCSTRAKMMHRLKPQKQETKRRDLLPAILKIPLTEASGYESYFCSGFKTRCCSSDRVSIYFLEPSLGRQAGRKGHCWRAQYPVCGRPHRTRHAVG